MSKSRSPIISDTHDNIKSLETDIKQLLTALQPFASVMRDTDATNRAEIILFRGNGMDANIVFAGDIARAQGTFESIRLDHNLSTEEVTDDAR